MGWVLSKFYNMPLHLDKGVNFRIAIENLILIGDSLVKETYLEKRGTKNGN